MSYDSHGRKQLITMADGSTISYEYGFEEGLASLTVTDPEGRMKKNLTDAQGHIMAVKEKDKGRWLVTRYQYNPVGEMTDIIDAKGNRTKAGYDMAGRRTSFNSPDTGLTEYFFDLAGNVTMKITPELRSSRKAITYKYCFTP